MKRTLFAALLLAVIAMAFSPSVVAQRRIDIGKGDTLIVKDPGSIMIPIVRKPTPKKNIPVPIIPARNQPTIIVNVPPQPVIAKTDQFSAGMIVIFSLMGALALAGFVLGLIVISRKRHEPAANTIINHGSHGYGGKAESDPLTDFSRIYSGDHSSGKQIEENHYWSSKKEEKKESPVTASADVKS
jgi:hypothetical protein